MISNKFTKLFNKLVKEGVNFPKEFEFLTINEDLSNEMEVFQIMDMQKIKMDLGYLIFKIFLPENDLTYKKEKINGIFLNLNDNLYELVGLDYNGVKIKGKHSKNH